MYLKFVFYAIALGWACCIASEMEEEEHAHIYMKKLNEEAAINANKIALAEWAYATNLTEENLANKLKTSLEVADFTREKWEQTTKFNWQDFKDEDLKRQFKKYSILGMAALPREKQKELQKSISEMQAIYSKAKICDYNDPKKCDLSLEPHLTGILQKSRDPKELELVWKEWRNVSGKRCKELFTKYVELSNEAAVLNNFTDNAEFWLQDFEDPNFQDEIEQLWEQVKPLYEQLHAYVRRKLREKYSEDIVSKDGPIPAHLLGNMWAQSWSNLDFTIPFPEVESADVTPEMIKQGYTPLKMFQMADDFFTSINLTAVPDSFWEKSIIEKPMDREIICHASAWDFYDSKDFRIKQCTEVTGTYLATTHHEMGHVQYFMQYKDQPKIYRRGANSGFHEAVGDVISLSVTTPDHLKKVGLLDPSAEDSYQASINYLFFTALSKVAFLPFGYLIDMWRWDVFRGKITPDNYNCEWWKLRNKYQGVEPPVDRTENDFDPGAKYHIIADVPYIRYFLSYVMQFQFHKALCIKAGQYDPSNPESKPLHSCDIYTNTEAGNLLGNMLKMGSSKPWPDAMEMITGQRKMDATPLLEYFSPLTEWLTEENQKTNEYIGWKEPKHKCYSQ